jgi:DNA-binding NarL/FixJ family response regulator
MVQHPRSPLRVLTGREREVLALVAEGLSNSAIGARLNVTEGAVAKHVGNVLSKLGLPPDDTAHRRVQAVLTYLRSGPDADVDLTPAASAPLDA